MGTRTPIAITLLVKNPESIRQGRIRFHDIGDYLSREQKLSIISELGSAGGIERANGWQEIAPDEHSDWLAQRDKTFEVYPPLGAKREVASFTVFESYSAGVKTNRDPWAYNYSSDALKKSMMSMISYYHESIGATDGRDINDSKKISWSWVLRERFAKGKTSQYRDSAVIKAMYRPFNASWLYYDGFFNENRYLIPTIFPSGTEEVRTICLAGLGGRGFSALMVSCVPDIQVMFNSQCFPRYLYDGDAITSDDAQGDLLVSANSGSQQQRDAVTDQGLAHYQAAYPSEAITKDDLFYYVYGLLHSEEYRDRFADNLSKQLPRIPAVKKAEDFWAFVEAGRKLGDLHCDYESVEPFPVTFVRGDTSLAAPSDPESFYRVEQMKFAGKRPNLDKTTVVYNANITISGIPLEAYDYVVNSKPALEWVMERQCVSVDRYNPEKKKGSGIVNDANRYAIETVGDPAYPLKLLQRVITVSLETMKIVRSLPPLGDLS